MAVYLNPLDNPNAWNVVVFGKLSTPVDAKVKVEGWARKNEYDIKTGKGTAGATETLKGQPPAEGTITLWAWTPAHFAAYNPILSLLTFKPGKGSAQTTAAPTSGSSAASQGASFSVGQTQNDAGGGTASGTIPEPGNTSGKASTTSDTAAADKSPPALSKDDAIKVYHPALADIGVSAILPPQELGAWEEDGEASGLWKRTIKCVEFAQSPNANIATTPTGSGDGNAPGTTPAGGSEGAAPGNGAAQQQGAASDAQGAWGAP